MPVNAFGISKSSESSKRRKNITGAAITGAGATAATAGAVGGGVPGVNGKFDWGTLSNVHRTNKITGEPNASGKELWGARAKSSKHVSQGGVFGWRIDAHKEGNRGFKYLKEKLEPRKHISNANAYKYGKYEGQIAAEHKVIPHMGKGKAISGAALIGGLGTTAYGVHHMKSANKSKVSKSQKSDRISGAAVGVGTTGAVGSVVGHKVFGRQERNWKAIENESLARAERIAPKVKSTLYEKDLKSQIAANSRNGPFKGKTMKEVQEVGRLRGLAGNARHIREVYGNVTRNFGHARLPAVALAGAGVAGLALHKDKKKISKSIGEDMYVSPFGVYDYRFAKNDKSNDNFKRGAIAAGSVGAASAAGAGAGHLAAKNSGKLARRSYKKGAALMRLSDAALDRANDFRNLKEGHKAFRLGSKGIRMYRKGRALSTLGTAPKKTAAIGAVAAGSAAVGIGAGIHHRNNKSVK